MAKSPRTRLPPAFTHSAGTPCLAFSAAPSQLQQAQLAVGNDQEIAAAAGRVKDANFSNLFMEGHQAVRIAPDTLKFRSQRIQEERLQCLQDVGFAGVVRAQVAPGLLVHDRLEQRAKDCR